MTNSSASSSALPWKTPVTFLGAAVLPAAAMLLSQGAAAQVVPPEADISRQRVAPLPLPEPDYDLRILTPEKSPVPRAVDEIQFAITKVKVAGVTVFSDKELAAYFAPLEGKKIVLDDLRRAADRLETEYRRRGYFLTRVFIPPQAVTDGALEVRVVEGSIGTVTSEAPRGHTRKLAQGMLGPVVAHKPIRLVQLEGPMLLLNDMPGVRAAALLRAGQAPGTTDLVVKADRRKTQSYAAISNFSSEAIGPMTYTAGTSIAQPFGLSGALDAAFNAAGATFDELQSFNARYSVPLGHKGIVASAGFVVARAAPGGDVADLDLRSRSESGNIRLRFPLLRTRAHSLFLDTGLSLNRSRVEALDQPITNDRSTVADVALSWRQVGWLGGDMTVRLGLAQGMLALGANDATTPLPSVAGFDPEFLRFTYVLQRNQPVYKALSAGLVVQGQHSTSRLLSGEQLIFGGSFIGRGYDPAQLVGDRGIGVLGELRLRVASANVPGKLENLQLYGFGDWAQATTIGLPGFANDTRRLASLGGGLRALVFKRVFIDGHVASARKTVSVRGRRGERVNVTATVLF